MNERYQDYCRRVTAEEAGEAQRDEEGLVGMLGELLLLVLVLVILFSKDAIAALLGLRK